MSADRELLELAAKAYWGSEIDDVVSIEWDEAEQAISYTHGDNQDHNGYDQAFIWNPLTDDGDALRLAVKLRIRLNWGANHDVVRVDYVLPENWPAVPMYESVIGGDIEAATRRAIVRAAAEIGRTL